MMTPIEAGSFNVPINADYKEGNSFTSPLFLLGGLILFGVLIYSTRTIKPKQYVQK